MHLHGESWVQSEMLNPCVCCSESERMGVFRHGDDFVAFGACSQTMRFSSEWENSWWQSVGVCWDQGKTWRTVGRLLC